MIRILASIVNEIILIINASTLTNADETNALENHDQNFDLVINVNVLTNSNETTLFENHDQNLASIVNEISMDLILVAVTRVYDSDVCPNEQEFVERSQKIWKQGANSTLQ
ncbi:9385_t:CDS:2 [Dentiscutata erythropus]|uniref:9385_t:CDS:1 n=1 Tax=Dentiscutata erythropus TaxID=1348616 RepID=A0A9N9EDC9_9GLOM|nr:9385_t:CDS:2 [Dentiscutata erythropus]